MVLRSSSGTAVSGRAIEGQATAWQNAPTGSDTRASGHATANTDTVLLHYKTVEYRLVIVTVVLTIEQVTRSQAVARIADRTASQQT